MYEKNAKVAKKTSVYFGISILPNKLKEAGEIFRLMCLVFMEKDGDRAKGLIKNFLK